MTDLATDEPPSPCIAICTMDATQRYCIGCYRSAEEIAGWSRYSGEQKLAVWERLEMRQAELVWK